MYESLQQWLSLMDQYGWILLVPLLERLWPMQSQRQLRPGLISDVIHVYQPFTPFLISAVAVYAATLPVDPGGVREFLGTSPWYFSLVAVILFSEVTFYIVHRLTHAIPLLWEFHRVHHSSVSLDSFSTHRFHILDKALFGIPYLACVLFFAPDPQVVFFFAVFQSFWDRYGHANLNAPRFTGYFITSPHFHRWHHEPTKTRTNFSRDFVFMDYLFGTVYYPVQDAKVFGEPGYSDNFFVQQWLPFKYLYQQWRQDGLLALLRPETIPSRPRESLAS